MEDLEEDKDNMNLDESAWFSMGSLLGQGTDNQPKAISGEMISDFQLNLAFINLVPQPELFITLRPSSVVVH